MNQKKVKASRIDEKKFAQQIRRRDRQMWSKLIDDLFAMPFKARCGFAYRLFVGRKIEHK